MNEAEIAYLQNWEPTDFDIAWTQRLIDSLKDGGVWEVPKSQNVFQMNKTQKVAMLIEGQIDSLFYQIGRALAVCGYKVELSTALATGAGKAQTVKNVA